MAAHFEPVMYDWHPPLPTRRTATGGYPTVASLRHAGLTTSQL